MLTRHKTKFVEKLFGFIRELFGVKLLLKLSAVKKLITLSETSFLGAKKNYLYVVINKSTGKLMFLKIFLSVSKTYLIFWKLNQRPWGPVLATRTISADPLFSVGTT